MIMLWINIDVYLHRIQFKWTLNHILLDLDFTCVAPGAVMSWGAAVFFSLLPNPDSAP